MGCWMPVVNSPSESLCNHRHTFGQAIIGLIRFKRQWTSSMNAQVGRVEYWLRGRITGIETPTCHVNLYRGNKDAEIVSALLPDEQVFVEEGLLAQFEDSNDASD